MSYSLGLRCLGATTQATSLLNGKHKEKNEAEYGVLWLLVLRMEMAEWIHIVPG